MLPFGHLRHCESSLLTCQHAMRLKGVDLSGERTRVMIFNCTSGRSGNTFLSAMLSKATEQLKKYGHDGDAGKLFDQVIFCANVTYADGGFKGGT